MVGVHVTVQNDTVWNVIETTEAGSQVTGESGYRREGSLSCEPGLSAQCKLGADIVAERTERGVLGVEEGIDYTFYLDVADGTVYEGVVFGRL